MSDRPTLYVELYCGYEHEGMRFGCTTREASRADLLAAIDGKQWKCVARIWDWMGEGTGYADCTPENPHDFCHWAVKP